MAQPETVVVYDVRTFEGGREFTQPMPFKVARENTERLYSGAVLEGAGQEVERSQLDESGHYGRVATGWVGLG